MQNIQSIEKGFLKRAQDFGVADLQARWLFKKADPGLMQQAGDFLGQQGQNIQQMAGQGADMFNDLRSQNPAAVDAGVGALGGAAGGAMMGGGKGALAGAGIGAGVGGLGMHPELMQHIYQQMQGQGQPQPPQGM